MRKWLSPIVALGLLLAAGCTNPVPEPREISLTGQPDRYTLTMSSAQGIRITADTGGLKGDDTLMFVWEASEGGFIGIDNPARISSDQVVWSPLEEEPESPAAGTLITVAVEDPETGEVMARGSLRITEEEGWYSPENPVVP